VKLIYELGLREEVAQIKRENPQLTEETFEMVKRRQASGLEAFGNSGGKVTK